MKVRLAVLALIFVLSACSSNSSRRQIDTKLEKDRVTFAPKINELISEQNYSEALIRIAEWKERKPSVSKAPWLMLYEGRSLLGVGNYEAAEKKFRKVMSFGSAAAPEYIALANYNLSYIYEVRNEDVKLISSLISSKKWSRYLPDQISEVTIPVRLASAYMRLGNEMQAKRYFKQADDGISKIRKSLGDRTDQKIELARIYFSAGNMGDVDFSSQNLASYLIAFEKSQEYLLIAADSSNEPWASQASNELIQTYMKFWNVISNIEPPKMKDKVLAKKISQEEKLKYTYKLYEALSNLDAMIVEDGRSKNSLRTLLNFIDKLKKELDLFILSRPVGEGLTEEAMKYEKLKREGFGKSIPQMEDVE